MLIKVIKNEDYNFVIEAKKIEQQVDCFIIELSWSDEELSFAEILHHVGLIPLPPYLNRDATDNDKATYQTIYAQHDGSVAAPTAGLHFTENLLNKLSAKNIQQAFVTLHVGAGTFKPVKALTMAEHEMHSEFIDVTIELLERLLQFDKKTVVAVGTTSLRTIESLYWLGVKIYQSITIWDKIFTIDDIAVLQWDAYELPQDISVDKALRALIDWMQQQQMKRLITKTQIIIAPGYKLKIAKGLITNFHQPQSTLLLLVAAIIGDDWRRVYDYALENDFRFLSYGDGSLLWANE